MPISLAVQRGDRWVLRFAPPLGAPVDSCMNFGGLPGGDLVSAGLRDLECGIESQDAMLVSIGAPRLERLGVHVTSPLDEPEHRLYAQLATAHRASAHSRYNALIRRLVSFERAAECERSSRAGSM